MVDQVGVRYTGWIRANFAGIALWKAIDRVVRAVGRMVVCVDADAEVRIEMASRSIPILPQTLWADDVGWCLGKAVDPDCCPWSTGSAGKQIAGEADVSVREHRAAGLEALTLATALLQRVRRADPVAGLWEAADVQWWWRKPERSDKVDKPFWIDDEGPVAGVLLTSGKDDSWQCDPVLVPGAVGVDPGVVWERALELAAEHASKGFDVPVSNDDHTFRELAERSGLTAGDRDSTAWLNAADQPAVLTPADGFVLVDRLQRAETPHHMRHRSGDDVSQRLAQCSLYDPSLDLAVETTEGRVAGYSLYWFDPTTKVGLVEPVRVEEEFQRKGLARAMLTAGIDRLVESGAERVKISYESDAAGAVYLGVGFEQTSTATWYRASPE